MTAASAHLNSAVKAHGAGLCLVQGTMLGRTAIFLVDCGASASFVSDEWLAACNVLPHRKTSPHTVTFANGSPTTSSHFLRARVRMGSYKDTLSLHVTTLSGFDVVLGKDWLNRLNPSTDWPTNRVTFSHGGKRHTLRGNSKLLMQKPAADGTLHPLLLSFSDLKRAVRQRAPVFLACVKQLQASAGASPVVDVSALVKEFPDLFPPDLPGMPPERDVQHDINLQPGAAPPLPPSGR
jgi:hypothetical protein